jgi:hypothetical protein
VSSTDDASSRLSNALDEIFSGGAPTLPPRDGTARPADAGVVPAKPVPETPPEPVTDADAPAEPTADWSVDDEHDDEHDDESYELPAIVPATSPVPLVADAAPAVVPAALVPTSPPTPGAPPEPAQPAAAAATGWSDHMATAQTLGAPLRAPGRRPRVRRVTRVLRHIDPWSTFKVALLFSAVAYVVMLTAGVLLWRVADDTGTIANVERWFTQFGWETFELKGGEIFHDAWIIGLFGVVAMTGGLVLLATLFNLVSDIVGGVRMTVLEEEVVERTVSSTRRYVVRRAPADATMAAQNWDVDSDDPTAASGSSSAEWSVDDDANDQVSDVADDRPDDPAGATTG